MKHLPGRCIFVPCFSASRRLIIGPCYGEVIGSIAAQESHLGERLQRRNDIFLSWGFRCQARRTKSNLSSWMVLRNLSFSIMGIGAKRRVLFNVIVYTLWLVSVICQPPHFFLFRLLDCLEYVSRGLGQCKHCFLGMNRSGINGSAFTSTASISCRRASSPCDVSCDVPRYDAGAIASCFSVDHSTQGR